MPLRVLSILQRLMSNRVSCRTRSLLTFSISLFRCVSLHPNYLQASRRQDISPSPTRNNVLCKHSLAYSTHGPRSELNRRTLLSRWPTILILSFTQYMSSEWACILKFQGRRGPLAREMRFLSSCLTHHQNELKSTLCRHSHTVQHQTCVCQDDLWPVWWLPPHLYLRSLISSWSFLSPHASCYTFDDIGLMSLITCAQVSLQPCPATVLIALHRSSIIFFSFLTRVDERIEGKSSWSVLYRQKAL